MASIWHILCWLNLSNSSFLILITLVSCYYYYTKINEFYIRKRRPYFVLILNLVMIPMACQTAWDPFIVTGIAEKTIYWRVLSFIGAGIGPTLCQFLYAARYWHLVYDINYHSSLINYWFRDIDKKYNNSWWVKNFTAWGVTTRTVIISCILTAVFAICGHLPARFLYQDWFLFQYFLLEPIIYGLMMIILVWGYREAEKVKIHTSEFNSDILFIHREFWKIFYWVMLAFTPIMILEAVSYLIWRDIRVTVLLHTTSVDIIGIVLVYYSLVFPIRLMNYSSEDQTALIIDNHQYLNTTNSNSSSESPGKNNKLQLVPDIKLSKPKDIKLSYLAQIFEKEKYIRHFLAFSAESLATENLLAFVEIRQLLDHFGIKYKDPIPDECELNIAWIPVNGGLIRNYTSGCVYIYNKYLSNNAILYLNVGYETLNKFKSDLYKIKKNEPTKKEPSISVGGSEMDTYLCDIDNFEDQEEEIDDMMTTLESELFDDILSDIWCNMESLFYIYKHHALELSITNQSSLVPTDTNSRIDKSITGTTKSAMSDNDMIQILTMGTPQVSN